jgi:hypothetical protein
MKASLLFAASLALATLSIAPANAAPVRPVPASDAPERVDGCSYSNQYAFSAGCKNPGHFKTYSQCMDAGIKVGWTGKEMAWYCTSLRLP